MDLLDIPNEYTGESPAGQLADVAGVSHEKPRVSTPEEAARLAPGTTFIGPDTKEHIVPYKVTRPEQIADIPDGADFTGPDGKLRQKPKYEGIDFTAQTLYDMGVNDKERKRALERSYKGKVRDDPSGGFYVEDDDGVMRKPGRGMSKVTGAVASAAAPTILSVLGALGGGAAGATGGSVVPVAGTIAGGTAGVAAGGAGGAILGQTFNDLIMGLAGTYDRSRMEQAAETGMAAAGGMIGAGVGRGISTVVPSLKSGVSAMTAAAPAAARSFLGAGEADIKMTTGLADKGVAVPTSAWAKEAPHLQNVVEVFDPAFHTNQPLLESATAHYEKSAGETLRALGVKDPGSLTKPLADVPTKEAGEAIMRRTLGELAESDAKMQAALDAKKTALETGAPGQIAQRETIQKAAEEARTAAQRVIDAGYKDIEGDIKTAMQIAKAGHNSGDLWGAVGQKLVATRQAIGARATKMYDAADQAAGGHLPNTEGLPHTAQQFLDQLPPDFQSKYPDMIRKLRDLAGVKDEKTGEWIKEPFNPTFGQLHDVRSQFRSNINYSDLTPDIRDGAYKFFAGKVDQVLHGINEPEIVHKVAVRLGDQVVEGPNHFEAIKILAKQKGVRIDDILQLSNEGKLVDGFITSKGKFVDRAEADQIATRMGQRQEATRQAEEGLGHNNLTFGAPNVERVRALKEASTLLNDADAFYRENIKTFNAQQVKAVMRGLESGEPADPQNLYNVVVKSGQTDLTQKLKEMVGPNLWAGVKAADMQSMLDASKTLQPGVIDGRTFAREVLSRERANTLEVVHGREATDKLLEQARRIEMLAGRLEIPVRPGDTVTQVLARARQAEELAKAEAKRDPLSALSKEMKKVEVDHAREAAKMQAERRKDPLGFLYNPTTGASEAVDKILASEDLILASAAKFGEQSPEFEMLRQVWAQRLLTGGMRPGQELVKISPEVQQIMFPGVTLNQAQTLAKEMDFLLDTRAGSRGTAQGMAAMAKVEHPWGTGIGGKVIGTAAKAIPGSGAAARLALGSYYGAMRKLMTSPALLRWLEKGLNGSPADREAVRQSVQAVLQKGGAVGAGAGEAAVQGSGPPQ